MAHRVERYRRDLVCHYHRDPPPTGPGRQRASVSPKSHRRRARIHPRRRLDLLVRPSSKPTRPSEAIPDMKIYTNIDVAFETSDRLAKRTRCHHQNSKSNVAGRMFTCSLPNDTRTLLPTWLQ